MKKLKITLCALLVLCSGLIFAACGETKPKEFNTEKISITNTEAVYDGTSHIFEVEYEDVDLDVTYSVDKVVYKYENNLAFINAGTYDVYYKISANGYTTYVSENPVQMTISKKDAVVTVSDTIICKSDEVTTIAPDYTIAGLVGSDNFAVSFEIGENVETGSAYYPDLAQTGSAYYHKLITNGHANYNVVFDKTQNGKVLVKDYVGVYSKTGEALGYVNKIADAYALLEEDAVIKLYSDINVEAGEYTNEQLSWDETKGLAVLEKGNRVDLRAVNKSYKFTIDLNGYKVNHKLDFRNYQKPKTYSQYGIDVTIIDSSADKTGAIGTKDTDYGITVFGDENIKLTMDGITAQGHYAGICYSGNCAGSKITATNSEFKGLNEGNKDSHAGAYMAGKANYTFTNCKFEGMTGYYAKSGSHELTNCTFIGNKAIYTVPTYNGSGFEPTGSAVCIDSAEGYKTPLSINLINCTYNSLAGYCVEEFVSKGECYAYVNLTGYEFEGYAKDKPVSSQNNCIGYDGELPLMFDETKFEIKNAEVVYNGTSQIFDIEYENVDLEVRYAVEPIDQKKGKEFKSANELSFVDAGTYEVYYKVIADGYITYTSSSPVTMTINKATATVTVGDTIICKSDAVTTINPEYSISGLVGQDTINVSFGIGKNADTNSDYVANLAVPGSRYNYTTSAEESKNYNVVFNAQGKILVKDYFEILKDGSNVKYASTLEDAYALVEEGSVIKLYKDILANGTALDDVVLKATDKNYDFTIDLNGHKLEAELDFVNWISGTEQNGNVNYTEFGIKVNIVDSSEEKTGVVGGALSAYGVLVKGDEKISVTMSDISAVGYWGGLYYNGNCADATISAQNCIFQGITVEDETNCGAYMAGDAVCTFVNCTFEGMTGYYVKSGSHMFNTCTFIGNKEEYQAPQFNGNGADETGSAFVVDLAKGYTQPLIVEINGGTFTSVAGYCIEQNTTTNGEPVDVHPDTRIVLTGSNSYLHYGENKTAVSTTNSVIQGQ